MESCCSTDDAEANAKMDFDAKEMRALKKVIFEPIRIGPVSTLDEMDCKVLQFRNKKLDTKLEEYHRVENELQRRIEQLEKRQSRDKMVLSVVNRYWNHLNDDVKTMLLEFDDECQNVADEMENQVAVAFVRTLASCNERRTGEDENEEDDVDEEGEEKEEEDDDDDVSIEKAETSTKALAKIMRAYDRILAKYERTFTASKSAPAPNRSDCDERADEFDGLEDGDHVEDEPKKGTRHGQGVARDGADWSDADAAAEAAAAAATAAAATTATSIAVRKRSACGAAPSVPTAANAAPCAAPNGRLTSATAYSTTRGSTDGQAEAEADLRSPVDGGVRAAIADLVERVARQDHSLKPKRANDDVTEEGDREMAAMAAAAASMDVEDDANNLDVRLTPTVQMTDDRTKRTSQVGSAALHQLSSVCADLADDNQRLRAIVDAFYAQRRQSSSNARYVAEALVFKEHEYERWKSGIDDVEYENEKLKRRRCKIECHLSEAKETLDKIKSRKRRTERNDSSNGVTKKLEELEDELEMRRKLACNRSHELELLRAKYTANLEMVEELRKSLNVLPEEAIEQSAEYECLRSQYSVLHNDTVQIKDQIEEYHAHIQTLNATFANKMEMTETEDLMTLRKLETDLLQMQQANSQLRREYQMLKIEFERNMAANEQTGPLNKEMRHLLARLQKHNKHLKYEALRYKRKYKELNAELNALSKQSYNDVKFKMESEGGSGSDFDDDDDDDDDYDYSAVAAEKKYDFLDFAIKEEPLDGTQQKFDLNYEEKEEFEVGQNDRSVVAVAIAIQPESHGRLAQSPPRQPRHRTARHCVHRARPPAGSSKMCSKLARKRRRDTVQECRDVLRRSDEQLPRFALMDMGMHMDDDDDDDDAQDERLSEDKNILELKNQLEKAETEQKELKLLLDTYKSVNRDKRDKMQLAVEEKKLRNEIEETKTQMRRILEIKRENRKKLADEDALRKIKYLEEQNFLLLRQINNHKQEEEALLGEMEVTNQAFEDMQEQNSRLIQHLREKDDANSKLMAERIKSNLLYKITRQEKESLQALINATAKQLDSVTTVLNELEEKERVYQTAVDNVEKEINLRQQSSEFHRKKALEYAHHTSLLKLDLEKYLADVKESKDHISQKSVCLDSENFKRNRLQEEVSILQRRLQRMKKVDALEAADVVLVEQVREYKEMLTCQSCKVRRKDAVLSKCFHVFCWECLRTRYETRQRKCPKCNAAFGANDYHRLFFAS